MSSTPTRAHDRLVSTSTGSSSSPRGASSCTEPRHGSYADGREVRDGSCADLREVREGRCDEYWVFDLAARRVVVHREPRDGSYADVREPRDGSYADVGEPRDGSYADVGEVRAGERIAGVQAGLPDLVVDELLAATYP